MATVITEMEFEDWVGFLFDHPVTKPEWYWDIKRDEVDLKPGQLIAHTTQLFDNSGQLLSAHDDARVNQGLWFFTSEITSPLYALGDRSVPLETRVRCIASIEAIFTDCFLPRCTQHLSHCNERERGAGAMNPVCYMWWDIFPICGMTESAEPEIHEACLAVMEATLKLPSEACQESALHGLAHWGNYYPEQREQVIAAYLERHTNLRAELRNYAECARTGVVN